MKNYKKTTVVGFCSEISLFACSALLALGCNGVEPEPLPSEPVAGDPPTVQTLPAQIEVNESFESARAKFLANARAQGDLDEIYLEAMRTAHQKLLGEGMVREAELIVETYDLETGKLRNPTR